MVASLRLGPAEIEARAAAVRREVLGRSPHVGRGDFNRIGTSDLRLLFALYDRSFFSGAVTRALGGNGNDRLGFRLSKRMTSAGGKVLHYPARGRRRVPTYEIAISTHLLFTNFREGGHAVHVNGILCRDRLDALQRIFEHELVHLIELLLAGASSCKSDSFRDLARRTFGHTEVTHRLVTAREKALTEQGLKVGDRVAFSLEGERKVGFVNRITKRATVLVEDAGGLPYTDGKRYLKFYVPLALLERRGDAVPRGR